MAAGQANRPNASSRREAYQLLLNGRYRQALRAYELALGQYPSDPILLSEEACAHAALGHREAVSKITRGLSAVAQLPQVQTRLNTAEAWQRLSIDRAADVDKLLEGSIEADPSFSPSVLTLARYWLWSKGDPQKARTLLQIADGLGARSLPWYLTAMGLEAEVSDFRAAWKIGAEGSKAFPSSVKLRLGAALGALASTPRQGFVLTAVLSLGVAMPFAGIWIYVAWAALTGTGFVLLRRVSGRLSTLAIVNFIVFSLMLGARAILWGGLYP
jgi:tetratricopeptide (TPR) repeat protein